MEAGLSEPGLTPCANHAAVPALRSCERCGAPFCPDCLVTLRGLAVCAVCKQAVLRDLRRRVPLHDPIAADALICALVGLVICQPVLQPLALVRGIQALRRPRVSRPGTDRWKAITAVGISSGACLLMLGALIYRLWWFP